MAEKTRPTVDHSTLSPSGKVSSRARKAAQERAREELFGDGLAFPQTEQPTERERLLRRIAELEELAGRGMGPRKHWREAKRLRKLLEETRD